MIDIWTMIGQQSASHNDDYTRQAKAEVEIQKQIDIKEKSMYYSEAYALVKAQLQQEFALPIFLNESDFPKGRFDPTKIVLRANQLGISGVALEGALGAHGIRVEMADSDTVVFLATLADAADDFDRLAKIVIESIKKMQGTARPSATALSWSVIPEVKISMRGAYFAKTEMVSRQNAIGRISADLIAPYPPGVAVIAPGEVLTQQIVSGLTASKEAGVRIAYATDPTLNQYRVVIS